MHRTYSLAWPFSVFINSTERYKHGGQEVLWSGRRNNTSRTSAVSPCVRWFDRVISRWFIFNFGNPVAPLVEIHSGSWKHKAWHDCLEPRGRQKNTLNIPIASSLCFRLADIQDIHAKHWRRRATAMVDLPREQKPHCTRATMLAIRAEVHQIVPLLQLSQPRTRNTCG